VHLPFAKELLNLGFQFFAIQISALVMYTTSNIIITQLFGPAEVTPYNIAFRYFGIVTTVFGLITAPLWSAFSEAYFSNDLLWVRKVTKTMIRIWCVLIAVVAVMIFASDFAYRLWIGKGVQVPFALSLWMGIFVILMAWGQIFVNFINGTGKIRLQLYASAGSAVLNIPITLVLVQVFHFGIAGVIMATCLLQAITSLWIPIQYRKLVSGTAKGIWAR
jgi:O-antigen/teichoic acid export membrane protein